MVVVKDGDCIASLAEDLKLRKFKTLWDDNAALHASRPNPNQLVVGDTVEEPKAGDKAVAAKVAKRHVFSVEAKDNEVALNIVLLDLTGKPLGEAAWELSEPAQADGKPAAVSGTTGADGKIEIKEFPLGAKTAKLKVTPKAPPPLPPAAAPPAITDPPAYPAAILPTQFKDKMRDAKPEDAFVDWDLKVGSMPSFNVEPGVVARLENLGAPIGIPDRVERSIKSYQKAHMGNNDGDGAWGTIQGDIRDRHDTPGGK